MADGADIDGFLGVAASLSGRRWRTRPADPDLVRAHQARSGLSEPLARALAARQVSAEAGGTYLAPTLKALFPDPSSFAGMDDAARILIDALVRQEPMTIFADYDVDGASSAALLVRWFRAMGVELPIYIPDRLTEGFGPTPAAFRKIQEAGAKLVVTLDCGAAAHDAIAEAAAIGLNLIVIDHHLMDHLPAGVAALVNPNRPDCGSGQGNLPAAGVAFVLLAALNREARGRGLFSDRPEPDLLAWLDLAALGAVCDVTQLTGFNRALAAQGLKVMSGWANPGLAALRRVAGLERDTAGVFEAGFVLGPRINAGGRIGRCDLGARLLSTDDPALAADLAQQLDALNAERKAVERAILEEAIAVIEAASNFDQGAPILVVAREGWHPGVVGIVASRLRERYRRPAIVLGIDPASDIAKGSGRSQPGVNLGRAISEAYREGLLLSGGGHAMAAGMTLRPSAVPELRAFLADRLSTDVAAAVAAEALDIDALISPGPGARQMLELFRPLAPFGPGAPEPMFALADVRVQGAQPVRGGHIRCRLVDAGGAHVEAIAWRAGDSALGARLLAGGGALHAAGKLKENPWRGPDAVQFEIEDLA
ncbi:MAG TPA: single-stranded-DNA-specific exonuclease RecJ [Caulobacteraceae bacterium]|nr:single-stranded-DNA-specific exonuclease RecJ [Caulobacteraceae bacterium]